MCKFGRDQAICPREEAIFVPAQKCSYHVTLTLTLTLSTPWMHADLESIVCKFGGDPAIFLREKAICAKVYRQTRRTDDGRRAIALAHSWNELKMTIFPTPLLFRLKLGGVSFGVDPSC